MFSTNIDFNDDKIEVLDINDEYEFILNNFVDTIEADIQYINNSIEKLNSSDQKYNEILNKVIKIYNNISGFSKLLNINKLFLFSKFLKQITLYIKSKSLEITVQIFEHYKYCNDIILNIIILIKNNKDIEIKIQNIAEQFINTINSLNNIKHLDERKERTINIPPIGKDRSKHKAADKIKQDEVEYIKLDKYLQQTFPDYIDEAEELYQTIENTLIELEKEPLSQNLIDKVFRAAHTLKGNSSAFNIKKIAILTHKMENLLDEVRKSNIKLSSSLITSLLECNNAVKSMVDEVSRDLKIKLPISRYIDLLDTLLADDKNKSKIAISPSDNISNVVVDRIISNINSSETPLKSLKQLDKKASIRVSTEKLDNVINLTSELIMNKIRIDQQINNLLNLVGDTKTLAKSVDKITCSKIFELVRGFLNTLTDDVKRIKTVKQFRNQVQKTKDKIINSFDRMFKNELVEFSTNFKNFRIVFEDYATELFSRTEQFSYITSILQEGVMSFRMVPISQLFNKFPNIVRSLSKELNKKVELSIVGQETEIDKTIIERISDPIIHILRNAIDHGIENPDHRIKSGKNETGKITLRAYYHGSQVIVEIEDDGSGLNLDNIIKKAIEKKIVSEEEAKHLPEYQIHNLIFKPGFSTSKTVTDVSGRGVGMDVVNNNITKLRGVVLLETVPDKGTKFILKIPLTLAIIQALLVKISNEIFAVPITNIDETIVINHDQIKLIGTKEVVHLRDTVIPLVRLSSALNIHYGDSLPTEISVIIANMGSHKVGLMVDKFLGKQEIVVKTLGKLLKNIQFAMGATILGNGKIVIILNIPEILQNIHIINGNSTLNHEDFIDSKKRPINKKDINVLVVEDSPVGRSRLKRLLIEEGYSVSEAENGLEALKIAKKERFHLICTDFVMPVMDGLELVENLRLNNMYKNIPILMITSKDEKLFKSLDKNTRIDKIIPKKGFNDAIFKNIVSDFLNTEVKTNKSV